MISSVLNKLMSRVDLGESEMTGIMESIFSGGLTDAQSGAFLAAIQTKGISAAELTAAARVMRSKCCRIQSLNPTTIDTCGTGGDSKGTFNISTATAFVVAGAGITVAKHGNRSVSSNCGSADVLEKLGVIIDIEPEVAEAALNSIGISFLFAQKYHKHMKHIGPVRRELGVKTMFNLLGPLTNPAGARYQLIGVYSSEHTQTMASALNMLGTKRAMIVCGYDGLDEISVCDCTRVTELDNGSMKTYDLDPENFFGETADENDLVGGDAQMNAQIIMDVLNGCQGPKRNVVLINAAAAIYTAGKADNMHKALELAKESIDSGSAKSKLEQLARFTAENS